MGTLDGGPSGPSGPRGPVDPPQPPAPTCDEDVAPTPRRLSHTEYRGAVGALAPGYPGPLDLPADPAPHWFENDVDALSPSELLVRRYYDHARTVAPFVVAADGSSCGPGDHACGEAFVRRVGRRAFGRPLDDEEVTSFAGLFALEPDGPFGPAAARVVEAMLQSPRFLYHDPRTVAGQPLDAHERARRLAFFLWGTLPDEALLARAEAGALDDAVGVEAIAREMVADPRASAQFVDFFRQWLGFSRVRSVVKNTEDGWRGEAAVRETERFVRHVFESDGTLSDLLTSRTVFLDETTAGLYGVAPPTTDGAPVELDRPGILTRAAFLGGYSRAQRPSPILRAVFVVEHLLCMEIGSPPPSQAGAMITDAPDPSRSVTNRELVAEMTSPPSCMGCHGIINPIGFAFEHFDQVGRRRELDQGRPVDASGALFSGETFADHEELLALLASSPAVARCTTDTWLRFAYGGGAESRDACMATQVHERFLATDRSFRELLVAIVTHPQFFAGVSRDTFERL